MTKYMATLRMCCKPFRTYLSIYMLPICGKCMYALPWTRMHRNV